MQWKSNKINIGKWYTLVSHSCSIYNSFNSNHLKFKDKYFLPLYFIA